MPLDSSSILSETIIITGPSGHVPARVWCSGNQVYIKPRSDLTANGRYDVRILKGLKYVGICAHSPEGEPLVEGYSFSFTTGSDFEDRPVASASEAASIADNFLRECDLKWGKPVKITRTWSGWFRVQYNDYYFYKRLILVDNKTSKALFPLAR
jgi:hypothetical protein